MSIEGSRKYSYCQVAIYGLQASPVGDDGNPFMARYCQEGQNIFLWPSKVSSRHANHTTTVGILGPNLSEGSGLLGPKTWV